MKTKEEILKQMEEEMPFEMIGSGQMPYILEAMEIYAQEVVKNNTVLPLISSISSMNKAMKEFLSGIDEELEKDPHNEKMLGAKWAYSIAISQFHNRFNRYCR